MQNFIEDGWSEKCVLTGEAGLYGPFEAMYRPLLPVEAGTFSDRVQKMTIPQVRQEIAIWLAKQLVSWNITTSSGEPVPITKENVGKLREALYSRLWLVVSGQMPDDQPDGKIPDVEADLKN